MRKNLEKSRIMRNFASFKKDKEAQSPLTLRFTGLEFPPLSQLSFYGGLILFFIT